MFALVFTSSLIGFASPAAAADYTINCDAPGTQFIDENPGANYSANLEVKVNNPQGVTVTVSVINCGNWETQIGSTFSAGTIHTSDFILAIPVNSFGSVSGINNGDPDNGDPSTRLTISVYNGFVPNPDSTRISTLDISLANQTIDLNNSVGWVSSGKLASRENCRIEGNGNGYYQTQSLNIIQSGSYTFRIVNTSGDNISDPFLALYTTFNGSNLDSGLVGCADDYTGPQGAGNSFISSGTVFSAVYSYFKVDLAPGSHTIVLTPYFGNGTFLENQTATVEIWGPSCGIEGPVCTATRAAEAQAAEAKAAEAKAAEARAAEAQAAAAQAAAAQAAAAELASRTVSAKKKYAAKSLAQQTGVPIVSPKAKVSMAVAKASKPFCVKSGSSIKTLKAGNCVVTFTVQEPKPKKGKKPKATKTVKTLVVQ